MAGYVDLSVVALGSFNPAIFQPEWFSKNDILPSSEIEAATKPGSPRVVVSNDVTTIAFDSLRLEVLQQRWLMSTTRLDWKKDLGPIVASIFRQLPHTPVTTLGFNVAVHREVQNAVAVIERWVPARHLAQLVGEPISIGAVVRSTWDTYKVTVQLEPSARLPYGIFLAQNFEKTGLENATQLAEQISADWARVLKKADEVADTICTEHAT